MSTKLILTTLIFLIVVTACGQSDGSTGAVSTSLPTTRAAAAVSTAPAAALPSVQHLDNNYVFVHSLKERIAKSTLIVIGQVRETAEVINLSRNVEDITKPATDSFSVGQVYHVQATRYIKGSGPDVLNLINLEGDPVQTDSAAVTDVQMKQSKANATYPPLRIGQNYLLFLDPFVGVDFTGTYFIGGAGAIYPWRFMVSSNGMMVAEGPAGTLLSPEPDFAPRPLAELLPQIEQLVNAAPSATPAK